MAVLWEEAPCSLVDTVLNYISEKTAFVSLYVGLPRKSEDAFQMFKTSKENFHSSLMMEAVRTSETSVDNHFTRQYIPEDNSEVRRSLGIQVMK
jgi:hypothetical protein